MAQITKKPEERRQELLETAASFCVYGQLGILLQTDIPGEERVKRIKTFLTTLLFASGE